MTLRHLGIRGKEIVDRFAAGAVLAGAIGFSNGALAQDGVSLAGFGQSEAQEEIVLTSGRRRPPSRPRFGSRFANPQATARSNSLRPANAELPVAQAGPTQTPRPFAASQLGAARPMPQAQEQVSPAAATAGPSASRMDSAELLISAHELASAQPSAVELTKIINQCELALQLGVTGDQQQFAHRLASWALNRRGEERIDAEQPVEALADFKMAAEHDPSRWRAVHNRGVSLTEAGQLHEALEDFRRTIELNPQHVKAHINMGALLEEFGELPAALQAFARAVELDDQMPEVHAGGARVLQKMGRLQEAQLAFGLAIELDPENANWLTQRGDLMAAMGDYAAALTDYGKAIELDPDHPVAYRHGSWLLATCHDDEHRDAESALLGARKALELAGETNHVCLDTLAAALANAGDYDEAVMKQNQAIEHAPESYRGYYEARLKLYRAELPYRMAPPVQKATYERAELEGPVLE